MSDIAWERETRPDIFLGRNRLGPQIQKALVRSLFLDKGETMSAQAEQPNQLGGVKRVFGGLESGN